MVTPRGPEAADYIRNLAVYIPGKPIEEVRRELGLTGEIVKLASNENPLGASPMAIAAIERAIGEINRYPDGGGFYLRRAIAQSAGVDPNQVILGNGSTEIIEMLAKAYLTDEEEGIFSQQSFVMYPIAIAAVNGKGIAVPARSDRKHDIDAMIAAAGPRTKLIYVANPSNPTGTYITRNELRRLIAGVPSHSLVIIDQAYQEYVDKPDYPDALDDLREGRANVVVLRTFSKIYGLASIRIGYGLAHPDVIATLNRVRSPFNTSQVAQDAALAAIGDLAWVERCRSENARERDYLTRELVQRNIRVTPSVTNFVLLELEVEPPPVIAALERRGVIVRPVGGPGLKNCVRASVGTHAENERFLGAFDEVLRR
jgi:histidinol-phosphate aminotransferase